jgi:hypothetical protein
MNLYRCHHIPRATRTVDCTQRALALAEDFVVVSLRLFNRLFNTKTLPFGVSSLGASLVKASVFVAIVVLPCVVSAQMTNARVVRGSVQQLTANGQTIGLANVRVLVSVRDGVSLDTSSVLTNVNGQYTLQLRTTSGTQSVVVKPLREPLRFSPDSVEIINLLLSATPTAEITVPPFIAQSFTVSGVVTLVDGPMPTVPSLASLGASTVRVGIQLLPVGTTVATAEGFVEFGQAGSRQAAFSLPPVLSGVYRLRQVFANGAASALQFAPQDTTITISDAPLQNLALRATTVPPRFVGRAVSMSRPLVNVPIQAVDAGNFVRLRTITDANGVFAFTVSTSGIYSLSVAIDGYPASSAITTVNWQTGAPADTIRLNAEPVQLLLTGEIQYDDEGTGFRFGNPSQPIAAPTVSVRALAGSLVPNFTATALAASVQQIGGRYAYTFRVPRGQYEVVPTLPGLTFQPATLRVNVTADTTNAPLIRAVPQRSIIRGRALEITAAGQVPAAGVRVDIFSFATQTSFSNRISTFATTNVEGRFEFSVPNGTYTVFVQGTDAANPTFAITVPNNFTNIVIEGSQPRDTTLPEFLVVRKPPRTFDVNGVVVFPNGAPLGGVQLRLSNRETPTVSAADGSYRFTGVTTGNYTVTASLAGYVFTPSTRPVTVQAANATVLPFLATLAPVTISGTVRTVLSEPVRDVQVRISVPSLTNPQQPAFDTVVVSNERGVYGATVGNLSHGQAVTVTPARQGLKFGPPARRIIADAPQALRAILETQDFRALSTTAGITLGFIRGAVSPPVAGCLVSDGTRSAVTDSLGQFVIPDVPNGIYNVTAALAGRRFLVNPIAVAVANLSVSGRQAIFSHEPVFSTQNRPPVIQRLPGNPVGTLRANVGQSVLFRPSVTDPNPSDILTYLTSIEDPTVARVRTGRDSIIVDPLSIGNTLLTYIVTDNQGGVTSATLRIIVEPPVNLPSTLVRRTPANTNHNASIVITRNALATMLAHFTADNNPAAILPKQDAMLSVGVGDEFAAVNERGDVVGSLVISDGENVLPVWSSEPSTGVEGMEPGNRLHYEVLVNGGRRKTRVVAIYLLGEPQPWPIDNATIIDFRTTSVQQPRADEVLKVFPNPAADELSVEYTLERSGIVNCDVVNALGQPVLTLFDGYQPSGRYRLQTTVEELASGMYVCRLRTATTTISMRVTIIR